MRQAGYGKFIIEYIQQIAPGVPIYTEDATREIVTHFNTTPDQARKVVNVNFKRLADGNDHMDFKRYQKGVYYKPKVTVFGVALLNPMQVVIDNYVKKGKDEFGYETGPSLINKLGLTTQIPKYRFYATNRCNRYGDNMDDKLKVVFRSPVIAVNNENRPYLQLLDILQNKDKTPIDAADAQKRLINFIEQNNLDFRKLIALAQKHYGKEVTLRVAELAAGIEA